MDIKNEHTTLSALLAVTDGSNPKNDVYFCYDEPQKKLPSFSEYTKKESHRVKLANGKFYCLMGIAKFLNEKSDELTPYLLT